MCLSLFISLFVSVCLSLFISLILALLAGQHHTGAGRCAARMIHKGELFITLSLCVFVSFSLSLSFAFYAVVSALAKDIY